MTSKDGESPLKMSRQQAEREARRAAAMRENLRKRKHQAVERAAQDNGKGMD